MSAEGADRRIPSAGPVEAERPIPLSEFQQTQVELDAISARDRAGAQTAEDPIRHGELLDERERLGNNARSWGVCDIANERLEGVLEGIRGTSRPLDYLAELRRGDSLARQTESDVWGDEDLRNETPELQPAVYGGIVEQYVKDGLRAITTSVRGRAAADREPWQWDLGVATTELDSRRAAEAAEPNRLEEAVTQLSEAQ